MTVRLSRAEQVERNRELVLEAARRVLLDRGYAGATVEQISLEAGFSRGVVYSQFASKGEMFLELLERRIRERADHNAAVVRTTPGREGLRTLLRTNAERSEANGGWGLLLVEFRVHAARDPELNRRYRALHRRSVDGFAEVLRALIGGESEAHAQYAPALAEIIFSMDSGHVLELAAGTALLDPDALVETVDRLLDSLDSSAPPPERSPR